MPVMQSNRPLVALIGRTNVGKSTLWNRLTETGRALVSAEPHTTRDRRYGSVLWQGVVFDLVDTGGMDTEQNDVGCHILSQSEKAIREADLALFVVDAKTGILPQDRTLARALKTKQKRVWLVANKTDRARDLGEALSAEFFSLGLGAAKAVSANTSLGIGELLDDILQELDRLGHPATAPHEQKPLHLAIIGRPNVGKSSLVNSILGEERVIVSPVPHTTREPEDMMIEYKGQIMTLVDTAGIRKRTKALSPTEELGLEHNEKAIQSGDVTCLVFDATESPTSQDRHLAGMLEQAKTGLILVANKWDLVEQKTTKSAKEYEALFRQSFPFLNWAPLVFVSALKNQRTKDLLDLALTIQAERTRRIDYNALNRFLKSCIKAMKPLASYGPKSPRIYDAAQVDVRPPTFLITVHGEKENIHPNWVRFFQKRLREKFGFLGTPIMVKVRHLAAAKTRHAKNNQGPGMEAVAGKIREKKRLVNQTRRRQKYGGRRH